MAAKGRARDKSLSKLGNRMITTMLKNEKLAEKELDKKMKVIKDLERKSMVKICETSLDVKYDIRRKRNTHVMEEQIADENLNASFGQERVLRSPSVSRRGSLRPLSPKQDDADETASITSQETSSEQPSSNPAILINNERKENDSEHEPDSRRSSVESALADAPSPSASPCGTPPDEPPAIDEAEAQKMLKVFSQSSRGSDRRRTAPEITDLSPKLLIQLAKSSAEVKRRGSTHDVTEDELLDPTPPASIRRRGPATIELMQSRAVKENAEDQLGQEMNLSPALRRRGSAAVANSGDRGLSSPSGSPLLHRRGSSSVTNSKISLKQPLSPLLGRRGSGMAATLRPISAKPSTSGSNTDVAPEPLLPDLNGAGLTKRPSSPSLRRSLSPMRATPSLNRPSTARSSSSLSADSAFGDLESLPGTGEYDLGRRRGSRPGSAMSCYSMPPGGLLLPLDKIPGNLAGRRGSDLSPIDVNSLSPTSPLRKAIEDPQATLNPAPVSPSVYRRHSGTVEALQGRVDDFLKTLVAKSS